MDDKNKHTSTDNDCSQRRSHIVQYLGPRTVKHQAIPQTLVGDEAIGYTSEFVTPCNWIEEPRLFCCGHDLIHDGIQMGGLQEYDCGGRYGIFFGSNGLSVFLFHVIYNPRFEL